MGAVAIIQARMGSTRLPGKSLLPLGDATVLAHAVARTRLARNVDRVIVATTDRVEDEAIVKECATLGVEVVRGSERDVLDRYALALRVALGEVAVRITADCPLLDPRVIGDVIDALAAPPAVDYATNALTPSFPHGLDVEAMPAAILETAAREARDPAEREHVTLFIYRRPERFRLRNVACPHDWSRLRWTLDTHADYEYLRAIFDRAKLGTRHVPPFEEVAAMVSGDAALMELNARALSAQRKAAA